MAQLDLDLLDDCPGMVVGNIFDDAWKGVKSVVKSPVTKVVAGGLAVVFPPAGIPATAALVVADKVVRATDHPDKNVAAAAKRTIVNTTILAKQGNPGAQVAMKSMMIAQTARKVAAAPDPQALARAAAQQAAAKAIANAKSAARSDWVRASEGSYRRK